jgi:hypothetical protein
MPCSPLKVNRRFRGTFCLHLQDQRKSQARSQHEVGSKQSCMLVSYLAYSSTVKTEATCSSETSVDFQRTIWRYIVEDRTLHNHCCENFKSCAVLCLHRDLSGSSLRSKAAGGWSWHIYLLLKCGMHEWLFPSRLPVRLIPLCSLRWILISSFPLRLCNIE